MTNLTTDPFAQTINNPEAYFIPLGIIAENELSYERFTLISFIYGAWGPPQHGALPFTPLTHMSECRRLKSEGMRIIRTTTDLLSAASYTESRTRSWVSRPGRQIIKVEAELSVDVKDVWRPVATVSTRVMATANARDIERAFGEHVPGPAESTAEYTPLTEDQSDGYIESVKARAVAAEDGAGTQIHWVHAPHPTVLGEGPTAVERVMQVADTTSGIGAILSPYQRAPMSTDLVVYLHQLPQLGASEKSVEPESQPEDGGWVGIAARGSIGSGGIGMTAGELHNTHGPIGHSMQTLLVRPQG